MTTEIKTPKEALELLSFLSTAMSLSPRVQRQCKEAANVLLPALVDEAFRDILNNKPQPTLNTKPQPVLGTWTISKATSFANVFSELGKLHASVNMGRVFVFRQSSYVYHILYEELPSTVIQKPWTVGKESLVYFQNVLNFLSNRIDDMELLYVTMGASQFIYRHR